MSSLANIRDRASHVGVKITEEQFQKICDNKSKHSEFITKGSAFLDRIEQIQKALLPLDLDTCPQFGEDLYYKHLYRSQLEQGTRTLENLFYATIRGTEFVCFQSELNF